MKWYNPQTEPFLISGFPFYETDRTYRRMPLHPETPIILMPFVVGGTDMLNPVKLKDRMARRAVQQKVVEDLRAAGDENLHLLLRDEYLEAEFDGHPILHEATVDGLHYTDLGYFWSTQVLYQFLKKLL